MYLFDRFVYCVCEHKKINLRRSKKRGFTVLTFSRGSHFADGTEYSQKVWDVGISGEISGWVSTTNAQLQICGRWLLFQVAKSPITTRWQTLDLILLPTITWVSQTFFFCCRFGMISEDRPCTSTVWVFMNIIFWSAKCGVAFNVAFLFSSFVPSFNCNLYTRDPFALDLLYVR